MVMSLFWRRNRVFALTFCCYASLHACRKSYSNAKINIKETWGLNEEVLGTMDAAFMLCYALGLLASGVLGDSSSPKLVLVPGLFLVSVVLVFIGFAGFLNIASTPVLVSCMAINGLLQSTAWPNCVGIVGNWTDASSRGVIMAVWGTNANLGNVLGSLLGAMVVSLNLGIPALFFIPASLLAIVAILCLFLLEASPPPNNEDETTLQADERVEDQPTPEIEDSSITLLADRQDEDSPPSEDSSIPLLETHSQPNEPVPQDEPEPAPHIQESPTPFAEIEMQDERFMDKFQFFYRRFIDAANLPGVLVYSISYAAIKSVNYALFFWLPLLLRDAGYSTEDADLLSGLYDIGGIIGGLTVGYVSDVAHMRTVVVVASLILSFLNLSLLLVVKWHSIYALATLLMMNGIVINGPAILITTAVSADLGSRSSSNSNQSVTASVSGIVDGSGSLGAAITQYILGHMLDVYGPDSVSYILLPLCLMAIGSLSPRAVAELRERTRNSTGTNEFRV